MNKSYDRLQPQEMHDRYPETLDLNGKKTVVVCDVMLIKYSQEYGVRSFLYSNLRIADTEQRIII
jgi:hypothetical protein